MQPNNDIFDGSQLDPNGQRKSPADRTLWETAAIFFFHRKLQLGASFAVAVVTAGITLLISNTYKATSTVLLPEGGVGPLSAELQRLLLAESQARADARLRTAQLAIQVIRTVATIVTTYLFLNTGN